MFRTRSRIRREAANWVVRLAEGAGPADREAFVRWREADPRNGETYDRMVAVWQAAGRIPAGSLGSSPAGRPHLRYAMAAGIALVLAASLLLLLRPGWLPSGARGSGEVTLASAAGEIRRERLSDGSLLTLDSASRIKAGFGADSRRLVLLEGRARFEVAHEARPFIVSAGSSEIVATGTVFDVGFDGGRLSVSLIEGSVEVRPARGQGGPVRRLGAGHRLEIGPGAPSIERSLVRGDLSWPSGMLEFDEAPLAEAVVLVNRYGGPRLRLAGSQIGRLRISGAYRAGDVRGFARSVAAALGLGLAPQDDGSLLIVAPDRAERPN